VSAFECDLQRVLTDECHVFDAQVIGAEAFHPVEATWCTCFAAALGARTRPPELFAGVAAVQSILPNDVHRLALAVDVDCGGKRVGVLQLGA
jgi:hypothetical protein